MKKTLLSLLCLLLVIALTGCTSTGSVPDTTGMTLPDGTTEYTAPTGDSGLSITRTVTLYVPGSDGRTLTRTYADLTTGYDSGLARSVLQLLLAYSSHCISGSIQLSLYGQHPVTVSGGVCTVNLSSTALALDSDELYTAALCISSTLCALDGINAVNLLVADQAVGMDITGNLPLGTLTSHAGEDATALWNSFYERRAPLGSDASSAALTSTVTLYFPLENAAGVNCETRSVTFSGQTPQQLTAGLLELLSGGAMYASGCVNMPDIAGLMTDEPMVSDMLEGGRLVTLSFDEDLDEYLAADGIDRDCFLASILLTVTGFVPSVTAMAVNIGSKNVTTLSNSVHGNAVFTGGVLRRTGAEDYPMSECTVYLAKDGKLTPVTRSCTYDTAASPRELISRLIQGPTTAERSEGISSVLPYALNDSDILGLAAEGDTLLVNLSSFFASSVSSCSLDERLLCYSMVNTLCEAMNLRRVVFFFNGEQLENLQGTLSWKGDFLYAPGLNGSDKG